MTVVVNGGGSMGETFRSCNLMAAPGDERRGAELIPSDLYADLVGLHPFLLDAAPIHSVKLNHKAQILDIRDIHQHPPTTATYIWEAMLDTMECLTFQVSLGEASLTICDPAKPQAERSQRLECLKSALEIGLPLFCAPSIVEYMS